MLHKVIVIAGPTAAGKTMAAYQLAKILGTSVISADSRQCYQELTIGTAKPSAGLLADIPHYFINSHSISQHVNAALFEQLSLKYAGEIFQNNPHAILCGGTGLYIRAFCEGLDRMPEISPEVRVQVRKKYSQFGLSWLQQQLSQKDPSFYASTEIQNPQRLMRALEVLLTTGQSISSYQTGRKAARDFEIIRICLTLPKEVLQANIAKRVEEMIRGGLPEEVGKLLPYRTHIALKTVGYQEMFAFLDGKYSLNEAVDRIKTNTWQYAKRQLTWFRGDPEMQWLDARDLEGLFQLVSQYIKA